MADEEFIVEYVVDKRIGKKGKVRKSIIRINCLSELFRYI